MEKFNCIDPFPCTFHDVLSPLGTTMCFLRLTAWMAEEWHLTQLLSRVEERVSCQMMRWYSDSKYFNKHIYSAVFSQIRSLKGFSPEWVGMCLFRPQAVMQEKSHRVQLKVFSPESINMCGLRRLAIVQEKLHFLQANVFSPVCESMWYFVPPECLQE